MIKDKARKHAAHLFQCDEEAVVYGEGKVYASFAPDQAVMTLQQVAFTLWLAWDLAPGMDPGLEARSFFDPPEFNYPFGTHVALEEVVYDEDGVLLTDSYSTYPLIRATHLPYFEPDRTETDTPNNPLGADER